MMGLDIPTLDELLDEAPAGQVEATLERLLDEEASLVRAQEAAKRFAARRARDLR